MSDAGSSTDDSHLRVSPEAELARVMAEIAEALHGSGAALTSHPVEGPGHVIYAGPDEGIGGILHGLLATRLLDWHQRHADDHIWISGAFDGFAPHGIALPVRQVAGHSRLVITVFFDTLDAERRAAAEAMYLKRRPFAVGYFRLWQEERLQRQRSDSLRAGLDCVDTAVMLIDMAGMLVFANDAARTLLDAGVGIRERQGRLSAYGRSDNITLGASIAHVLDSSVRPGLLARLPLFTIGREQQAPLIVSVLPAPHAESEPGEVGALVFVADPDMEITDLAEPVCRVFGLTPVETQLACTLARGRTLQEAAEALRIKDETARSYLKRIFGKTGVNRQSDLIRMILISLVRVSSDQQIERATERRALS